MSGRADSYSSTVRTEETVERSSAPAEDWLSDLRIGAHEERPGGRMERLKAATSVAEALSAWFQQTPDQLRQSDRDQIVRQLNADVAMIDQLLNDQLNALLHHPQFQRLEASWRGLHYLTECQEAYSEGWIKIRVLNATWREIQRDQERAMEFDQSLLFQKVYENEFGTPGGEPYGVLLADYDIHPFPSAQYPQDDIGTLRGLAQVAAAAFCPLIANASPSFFGMDRFEEMEHQVDHARTFEQLTYLPWRSLRDSEDARFIGLALPRILMRAPYDDDGSRVDGFCFREEVSQRNSENYLWGGASYAWGEVLMRAFAQAGWLADIRGVKRDEDRGGLVARLPSPSFGTDRPGLVRKGSTEVVISDELERQLSELGFIALCPCKDTEFSAFFSNQSIQKAKRYDDPVATTNAHISSMLQYMFCVSRFAHYIKMIGRERIGSFESAEELERHLYDWIVQYVTADGDASQRTKADHPLRAAQVKVLPVPGKPGAYSCVMQLSPHYELDELSASIRLQAELTPPRGS